MHILAERELSFWLIVNAFVFRWFWFVWSLTILTNEATASSNVRQKFYVIEQINRPLKQHEPGLKVADICRDIGIAKRTFYRWKSIYGGTEVSEAKRLKELEHKMLSWRALTESFVTAV